MKVGYLPNKAPSTLTFPLFQYYDDVALKTQPWLQGQRNKKIQDTF